MPGWLQLEQAAGFDRKPRLESSESAPRLTGLRQRVAKLEAEAVALQHAAEQARSLQLVVGKLETFAALVRGQLDGADWDTRRDIIRTLVRRIEIDDQHVRVVFRVDPGPQDGTGSRRIPQHCPGRRRAVEVRPRRRRHRGRGDEDRLRARAVASPFGGTLIRS